MCENMFLELANVCRFWSWQNIGLKCCYHNNIITNAVIIRKGVSNEMMVHALQVRKTIRVKFSELPLKVGERLKDRYKNEFLIFKNLMHYSQKKNNKFKRFLTILSSRVQFYADDVHCTSLASFLVNQHKKFLNRFDSHTP